MLALIGASCRPAVDLLRAARGHQAEQGHDERDDEPAPLAEIHVQGIGQQRANGAAAPSVLIGLADEVCKGGDGHVLFDDRAGGEELHRGKDAQKQQGVHDDVEHAHALSPRGEDEQHAHPHQHQGHDGICAAAQAAHHIPDRAHGGARLGRGHRNVEHQQGQTEAGHRAEDLQRRAGGLRRLLICIVFSLICHSFLRGNDFDSLYPLSPRRASCPVMTAKEPRERLRCVNCGAISRSAG